MSLNQDHHNAAKKLVQDKMDTFGVRQALKNKFGLSNSQANDACHNARRKLKIYKKLNKHAKKRAQEEANEQAEKKTEVNQNA